MENLHEGFDRVLVDIENHLKSDNLLGARLEFRLALESAVGSQNIRPNKSSDLRAQVNKRLTSLGIDPSIIKLVTSSD
jgi:hypothetical protein